MYGHNFANNLKKLTGPLSPIWRTLLYVMVLKKVPEWFSLACIKDFFSFWSRIQALL